MTNNRDQCFVKLLIKRGYDDTKRNDKSHSMVILWVFLGIASHRKWCILSTFKDF